eukprot:4494949-Pyramimonas_sp.AAC.1
MGGLVLIGGWGGVCAPQLMPHKEEGTRKSQDTKQRILATISSSVLFRDMGPSELEVRVT